MSHWWDRFSQGAQLTELTDIDELARHERAIVFKHSPTCMISMMAHAQVMKFWATHPDVAIYLVSVRKHRELSRRIAEQMKVRHASPQVLILRNGVVTSVESHEGITADHLAQAII